MSVARAKQRVEAGFPFPGYMDGAVDSYDNIAQTVVKFLPDGGEILDFASGPCDKTAVLQVMGYKCAAIDDLSDDWHLIGENRQKIIDFASRFGIDFRVSSDVAHEFSDATFDMVMAHDVLEHIHDSPRELLNDLVTLLKPGGFLFVTVPNAVNIRKRLAVLRGRSNLPDFESYYWSPGPWRGHVREYVKDDLYRMARNLNLEICQLNSCHHMIRVLPSVIRPLYKMASLAFPGWRDTWLLVCKKPIGWTPIRELDPDRYRSIMKSVNPYTY